MLYKEDILINTYNLAQRFSDNLHIYAEFLDKGILEELLVCPFYFTNLSSNAAIS